LDFAVLAVFVWLIDERGAAKWVKPLVITGMNAIAVYMASEFLAEFLDSSGLHDTLYGRYFAPLASPMNASLLWALSFTLLMYLLAYFLYRRRWFLRV
jgi:predicted acyltransferase